jgi:hypothetical protein
MARILLWTGSGTSLEIRIVGRLSDTPDRVRRVPAAAGTVFFQGERLRAKD